MGVPDHFNSLLRNLCLGQEATVRTGHGTMDWFQIGEGICKAVYFPLACLTYMHSTPCKMPVWMKPKLESRDQGEISITSDMQITPPLWQKAKRNSVQFSSVAQSCPTLCESMNRSTPGLPVHHQLPEFTQTHVHRVSDAI